jgi:hypothetical protein
MRRLWSTDEDDGLRRFQPVAKDPLGEVVKQAGLFDHDGFKWGIDLSDDPQYRGKVILRCRSCAWTHVIGPTEDRSSVIDSHARYYRSRWIFANNTTGTITTGTSFTITTTLTLP